MFIFVDESGSFVHSPNRDSWSVVAAYVIPEHCRHDVDALMHRIRAMGKAGEETKLRDLSEEQYLWFLAELEKIGGIAFAVAVDVGLHSPDRVQAHRDGQADLVIEHREKMIHEAAREGLTALSKKIRSLPLQLYIQLTCQIILFQAVLNAGTLYLVQRHPPALGHFRWRLDQKASAQTEYEDAFRTVLPAILQTASLQEPMMALKGADYSHFKRFSFPDGEAPTYLKEQYGIEIGGQANDIGKIVREDFRLTDSTENSGVQVADLIAGGVRRLLRGGFSDPFAVARLLGRNFVEAQGRKVPVKLVSLDQSAAVSDRVAQLLQTMADHARPMLAR